MTSKLRYQGKQWPIPRNTRKHLVQLVTGVTNELMYGGKYHLVCFWVPLYRSELISAIIRKVSFRICIWVLIYADSSSSNIPDNKSHVQLYTCKY